MLLTTALQVALEDFLFLSVKKIFVCYISTIKIYLTAMPPQVQPCLMFQPSLLSSFQL